MEAARVKISIGSIVGLIPSRCPSHVSLGVVLPRLASLDTLFSRVNNCAPQLKFVRACFTEGTGLACSFSMDQCLTLLFDTLIHKMPLRRFRGPYRLFPRLGLYSTLDIVILELVDTLVLQRIFTFHAIWCHGTCFFVISNTIGDVGS